MEVKIITEIASTHNGNIKVLEDLTYHHLRSKSDYIKYQIFKAENLLNKNEKDYKKFKKIEISYNNWTKIINKFKKKAKIILEVFDFESYEFSKKFKKNVDLKISTSELDNFDIIEDAVKNFKKIFLNISGYDKEFIHKILKKYFTKEFKNKLIILYGFQGFPSNPKDLRLNLFDTFQKKKINYGYSDHSIYGLSDDFLSLLPIILEKKIQYFEKHICKNISKKPPDYISSLELNDFSKFVKILKKYNHLSKLNLSGNTIIENQYSQKMHKFAFSKKTIRKNKEINPSDIVYLRTSKKNGLRRSFFETKKKIFSKKFIRSNEILYKSNLDY